MSAAGPQCEFEFTEASAAAGAEALCAESADARVTCEATGDSLLACSFHAGYLAQADPDVSLEWLEAFPEPEAEP